MHGSGSNANVLRPICHSLDIENMPTIITYKNRLLIGFFASLFFLILIAVLQNYALIGFIDVNWVAIFLIAIFVSLFCAFICSFLTKSSVLILVFSSQFISFLVLFVAKLL
jgi:hypothetical protein